VIAFSATTQAQQYRPGYMIVFERDTTKTGFFHTINIEVDSTQLDSLISALIGVTPKGEIAIRLWANFSNGANDSTNLYVGVNGVYHAYPLPYNLYADRFKLITNEPNARGVTTFRTDLPSVTTDSCFVFRLSRNDSFSSGTRAALTVYKTAANAGLSFANTVGTFYDMVRFDEVVFGTTGVSRSVLITLTVKKNP
jgi:hypothetical protein